ncbi:ABC transporter ATP-binding protein [Methylomagnum ishizawai]|uniref:ABC transporter ATP-binding protein n=1 Tax=Methylomagnum ishizawai TaxID=1760988 RepID=UPI001C33A711|nr:ABC transporter ATP-binding protein [Methylomagnum ishizawai]BBL74594.1 sugar ABC transporter ATP-binding protein [Methylomagnum ishizawai]
MASVSFEHLEKTYPNGYHALRDFTLDIPDGELMVLVGPSGCGKSTLLRLLAGLEDISSGTLKIGGRVANTLSPQERNIAMVFQDYALYPTMTVRGNLEFPLKMRKLAKEDIRRRVAWAAELLDLGEVLDRLPKQLSGGQRQRVAMGRALVREPSVFLLDEPLSNLDAKLRGQVRTEIGELQRRMGATMLYVTHDQVEAMTLGRRIAVLHQGRIQQVADPKTLYERPGNPFVAGFIGSPPMNLFAAMLERDGPDRARLRVAGRVVAEGVDAGAYVDGAAVLAGIRPEAVHLAGPEEAGFEAVVVGTEYLGHETLLYFQAGPETQAWTARLPGMHGLGPGDRLRLAVAGQAVRLFPRED